MAVNECTIIRSKGPPKYVIRNGRYALVLYESPKCRALYDLESDPGQKCNVIDGCRQEAEALLEAFDAYAAAHRLAPKHPAYLAWARDAQRRLQPPTFARGAHGYREPPTGYRNDPMAEIEPINAINRANMQRTQPPMPGAAQTRMPPPPNLRLPQPYQPPVPGQRPRP